MREVVGPFLLPHCFQPFILHIMPKFFSLVKYRKIRTMGKLEGAATDLLHSSYK